MDTADISSLSNQALLARADELASNERERLCDLLVVLAEIDERRAYTELECLSLHEYGVNRLRYSDAAAYRRIRAVRAIRLFPPIAVLMRQGRLNLESVALLHPHLDGPDAASLVYQAAGMRTWQVARLLAHRQPPAPSRDVLRFASAPMVPKTEGAPLFDWAAEPASSMEAGPAAAEPAAAPVRAVPAGRVVRVAFTADEEFWTLVHKVRAVMRHKYPDGSLHAIIREGLVGLLKKKGRGWR